MGILKILEKKERRGKWETCYEELRSAVTESIGNGSDRLVVIVMESVLRMMDSIEKKNENLGEHVDSHWIYANFVTSRGLLYYHSKAGHLTPLSGARTNRIFKYEDVIQWAKNYNVKRRTS
jgi:hypothetical protein